MAQEYLLNRGLSKEVINFFDIGYAPWEGGLKEHLLKQGVSEDTMMGAGLLRNPYPNETGNHDFFKHRIIFPTKSGPNVVFISGRDLGNKSSRKYLNIPGPNDALINEDILLKKIPYVILTEGFIDCYTLVQNKFPAIGLAGCNRKKKSLFDKLLKIKTIYIMFDVDPNDAGHKGAMNTAYQLCRKGHKDVRIVSLPNDGLSKTDINQLYLDIKPRFKEIIQDILINTTKSFNSTNEYLKMEQDELFKPITYNDMNAQDSISIYEKHLQLQVISGKYLRCCCPFHGETQPSFTVYIASGFGRCFGCGLEFENGREFEQALMAQNRLKGIKTEGADNDIRASYYDLHGNR